MQRLFDAFNEAKKELFLVGGAVRDLALGVPMHELDDLDFCTNARPEQTLTILRRHQFNYYKMGMEFGTVGCVLHGPKNEGYPKDCQITTYRSEEYYRRGSRHPVVKFGDTIEQDLGRRDFSINSIAMDGAGQFIDPYDGLGDLKKGILRVIGDPKETLAEDPLRILRVGRFVSRLGFRPAEALQHAAFHRAHHILEISRERWYQEMNKLLCGPHVCDALEFLHRVRLLGVVLPEVDALNRIAGSESWWKETLAVCHAIPAEPALRWAALFHLIGAPWVSDVEMNHVERSDANPGSREASTALSLLETEEALLIGPHDHAAMLVEGIAKRFTFDNATTQAVNAVLRNGARAKAVFADTRVDPNWSASDIRRITRQFDPYLEDVLSFARAKWGRHSEGGTEVIARIERFAAQADQLASDNALRPELPSGLGKQIIDAFDLRPSPLIGELKNYLEHLILSGQLENGRASEYYIRFLDQNPPEMLTVGAESSLHGESK